MFAYLFVSSLLSSSEADRKRSSALTFSFPKQSYPRLNKAFNEKEKKKKSQYGTFACVLPLLLEGPSTATEGQNLYVSFMFNFIFVNQTLAQINICVTVGTMCHPGLAERLAIGWRGAAVSDEQEEGAVPLSMVLKTPESDAFCFTVSKEEKQH